MERVARKAKGMRVTFAFYSSWYLFAHGSHQQCPLCSQCSAPPSLQSHCARVNSSCLGSAAVEASAGEGRTLSCLSLASLGRIQLEREGALPKCPWRCEGINGIMKEKGVQVADTCPGWSQAGHRSCCPSSLGNQESRW